MTLNDNQKTIVKIVAFFSGAFMFLGALMMYLFVIIGENRDMHERTFLELRNIASNKRLFLLRTEKSPLFETEDGTKVFLEQIKD